MEKENFKDSYRNKLLLDFLKNHFDENLFTNYRNRGLYIAAQDVKPILVDKEDAFDLSASDIFNSIKFYLDTLIPSDNTLDQFSLSFKNNIIIYCDRNYDIENSISIQLYTRFDYNVIKIYNTDYLYVSYINQQMPVKGVINDINWLPYQNVYTNTYLMSQYSIRYNKIIEVIMKLYFSILNTHFKKS